MSTGRLPRSRRQRGWLLHALRVGLFATVIWLIHAAHRDRAGDPQEVSLAAVPTGLILKWYGEGTRLDSARGEVVDTSGEAIGRVLQTSPASDDVVGFSGPTNTLLALDTNDRIVGVQILSSGDTKEHVQQVEKEEALLQSLAGMTADEVTRRTDWDAVSGATLTSLAIVEGVQRRLGGGLGSLKFPQEPTIAQARQLFPEAVRMQQDAGDPSWWDVYDATDERIGSLLRTSPAADNIVGYQGPTETLIGFDNDLAVLGFVVGESFDNEPYVDYVREDKWYRSSFNDQKLWDLAQLDLAEARVEGVSGATMTSLAVADGMVAAAQVRNLHRTASREETSDAAIPISARNWGTIGVLACGLVIGLTTLRGRRRVRIAFQLVLIGYLGFMNGDLVSQAMLVGWAKVGVPWESMIGVFLLSAAAFLVPMATKRNVYCHHLCPHGAAQQWLRPGTSRHLHLPRWLDRTLSLIPGGLLVLVVAVAMGAVDMSLVDIEPFDAYLITIAGAATITIAVVGLIASAFVPMAYCRYGCPTGAAIEFVRRHARSDRVTARDAIAVGCLVLAWWLS